MDPVVLISSFSVSRLYDDSPGTVNHVMFNSTSIEKHDDITRSFLIDSTSMKKASKDETKDISVIVAMTD